jgi:hypothetical protein
MNEIERVKAEFLDDVFIIPQNEIIYRLDQNNERNYFKMDANNNPIAKSSVTSVIKKYSPVSPYLLEWWCSNGYENSQIILEEKARLGTFLHILWAKLLLRYNIDITAIGIREELAKYCIKENITFNYNFDIWHKKIKKDLISFIKLVQDYNIKPVAIEMAIIGEKAAGTIDLVCDMLYKENRIRAIIDWKSGENDFYDEYIIQLEGYKDLWNNKYPDYPVTHIFNFGCIKKITKRTKNFYRFEDQTNNPLTERWYAFRDWNFKENPEINIEKRYEIVESIINIESNFNDLIKEIDPLENLGEENAEDKRS